MNTMQAIILGVVQGATEFLPVSSSGHLIIGREIIGVVDVPVLFDVLLHVATLVAVFVVLRARIADLLAVMWRAVTGRRREEDGPYLRLIAMILVATVLTGALGIGLGSVLDIRSPRLTSGLFLVTGLILIATRFVKGRRTLAEARWRDALVVGVAQGFGVLPGISRSGITISASLFAGLDRATAGEFSFLLAIPAILGALVLTLNDAAALGAGVGAGAIIAGCLAALLTGLAALTVLLRVVRAGGLHWFALYLVPLGVWGLITF